MRKQLPKDEQLRELAVELVDSIVELANANRLTGLWDHVRFEECKKADSEIDVSVLITSERNSRRNVEKRAVYRDRIDSCIVRLAEKLRAMHSHRVE